MLEQLGSHPLVEEHTMNRNRGFRVMTPEQRKSIASKGGRAAHAAGTAHHWSVEEARAAGRKGGKVSRRKGKKDLEAE